MMGKYLNILFQAVKNKVLDKATNERPKTDLNSPIFSCFSLAVHSGHRGYKAKKFFGLNCISIMSVVPHNVKKLPRKVLSM